VTEPEVVLPPGYPELLDQLKSTVAAARWRAQRVVNTELLALYWRIGHTILGRQRAEGWGTRVIDRPWTATISTSTYCSSTGRNRGSW